MNSKTSSSNGVIWAKPKIKGIVGTEKLYRRVRTTVFSQHVRWCWSTIVDLKEVRVAVSTCLQLEEWESNMQNLTGSNKISNLYFPICKDCAVILHRADIIVHTALSIYVLWSHYDISWRVPGQKILRNLRVKIKGRRSERIWIWK